MILSKHKVTMFSLVLLALFASPLLATVPKEFEPRKYCLSLEGHRNHKDVYTKPGDCHEFVQCFYSGNHEALGVEKRCQDGTFFDPSALSCVQEGPVKCTRLHELPSDRARISETSCRDTFGNILHADPDFADRFRLHEKVLPCPEGRSFDLDICQCDMSETLPEHFNNKKQCQMWLPFDEDLLDHSYHKFQTYPSGDAALDNVNFFNGDASLRVKHGRLRVQGMKAIDLTAIGVPKAASWCFFFRCEAARSFDCLHEGGILSNSKDASLHDFTIVAAVRPNNKLDIRLGTAPQVTSTTISINWKQAGWNHVCVVLNDRELRIYVNGELDSTVGTNGNMTSSHQPYVIGSDRGYGNFIGNIDDVIACSHALNEEEIRALYNGDHDALREEGLFP